MQWETKKALEEQKQHFQRMRIADKNETIQLATEFFRKLYKVPEKLEEETHI